MKVNVRTLDYLQKIDEVERFNLLKQLSDVQKTIEYYENIQSEYNKKYSQCIDYINANPLVMDKEDVLNYLDSLQKDLLETAEHLLHLRENQSLIFLNLAKNKGHQEKIGNIRKNKIKSYLKEANDKLNADMLDRYIDVKDSV